MAGSGGDLVADPYPAVSYVPYNKRGFDFTPQTRDL